MKKWIFYLLILVNSLLVADKNNDEYHKHAQSWVPVKNQQNYAGYREYVNSVDGMRCRVIDSQTKQTFTTYNASGQKLDSFDLFYGNSTESSLMSSSPISNQSGQQQHSGGAQKFGSNHPQQNSAFVQNQQFIAERESSKAQMRAHSFDNEQTRDQEMALRLAYNLITFEEFQAYYQAKEDYKNYLEQQEKDKLQRIKDLKKLVARHKKEWSDLEYKHAQELRTEKNKSHQDIKRIKARHKQDKQKLLLQQYDEHPTWGKCLYLACKKGKDGVSSVFGTDYPPAPEPKKEIIISPQQIAQDIAYINNYQQQKVVEQLQTQTNLQSLYDNNCDAIQRNHDASLEFQQIMHDRSAAFESSLQNQTTTIETLTLQHETLGFMQAHNIDPSIFTQSSGLAINHQINREIIDVLDQLADCASRHCANNFVQQGASVCAQMATIAQQENHANHLSESISAANCSHGLLHYVQGMALDGLQRCDQMVQALAYYNLEASKYLLSATKGAAQGIASIEIAALTMQAIGSAASACAPALTATISSAVSAAAAPIAVAAGVVAVTAIVGEVGRLGYFYATDQLIKIDADYHEIKDFAAKFYDFDQTSYKHVENISQAATTLLWPVKAQAIIDSLQGIQKAQVNFYVQGKKVVEQTVRVSNEMLENAVSKVNSFEFQEFNATYKKIFGEHLFEFFAPPQVALAGISENCIEQKIVSLIPSTHLLTEQTNKVTEKVIAGAIGQGAKDTVGKHIGNEVELIVTEQITEKVLEHKVIEMIKFQEVLANEIACEINKTPSFLVDLSTPINHARAAELANLSPQIRQLQDLAKYTNNFMDLENLIPEDILYLNRIYELQTYRAQIKNFLEIYKPFFVHEEQRYYIEDISSYHIHAGDYFRKYSPDGGHSNYGGNKLDYFNPQLIKHGQCETKDVIIHNSRFQNKIKESTIYSEGWSEFICDLKAIEAMMSKNVNIKFTDDGKRLDIEGYISEGLKIKIFYDIANKRIRSHYPIL